MEILLNAAATILIFFVLWGIGFSLGRVLQFKFKLFTQNFYLAFSSAIIIYLSTVFLWISIFIIFVSTVEVLLFSLIGLHVLLLIYFAINWKAMIIKINFKSSGMFVIGWLVLFGLSFAVQYIWPTVSVYNAGIRDVVSFFSNSTNHITDFKNTEYSSNNFEDKFTGLLQFEGILFNIVGFSKMTINNFIHLPIALFETYLFAVIMSAFFKESLMRNNSVRVELFSSILLITISLILLPFYRYIIDVHGDYLSIFMIILSTILITHYMKNMHEIFSIFLYCGILFIIFSITTVGVFIDIALMFIVFFLFLFKENRRMSIDVFYVFLTVCYMTFLVLFALDYTISIIFFIVAILFNILIYMTIIRNIKVVIGIGEWLIATRANFLRATIAVLFIIYGIYDIVVLSITNYNFVAIFTEDKYSYIFYWKWTDILSLNWSQYPSLVDWIIQIIATVLYLLVIAFGIYKMVVFYKRKQNVSMFTFSYFLMICFFWNPISSPLLINVFLGHEYHLLFQVILMYIVFSLLEDNFLKRKHLINK